MMIHKNAAYKMHIYFFIHYNVVVQVIHMQGIFFDECCIKKVGRTEIYKYKYRIYLNINIENINLTILYISANVHVGHLVVHGFVTSRRGAFTDKWFLFRV